MGLYDQYLEMVKVAEEKTENTQVEQARVEVILEKTAEAEELIKQAGITEYTSEELADVVTELINKDIEKEESTEKIAQLYDAGRVFFHGFDDEMQATTEARK